jgi:hypothetical protein
MNVIFGGQSGSTIVKNGVALSANGSATVPLPLAGAAANLIVNVESLTGSGSIVFSITDVDPVDETTQIGGTNSTAAFTANASPVAQVATINLAGSCVKVAWTVTGTVSAMTNLTVAVK